ncbi:MAG: ribosomal protein S18-alanine N-acetyltransferase [Timaviella obliquedivisa GSE-PSE-MK23-08B]|jgi:ribosomal-protein-alanine N-acetyltransferase|nr:ribosomal protein S18-alanine N-acetyltransferase [Timaviella obliquedivisa GSE-PSE-MK23-08B]
MKVLELKALEPDQLEAVVELDRRSLGGMWTIEGYRREMDSPNSDLLILRQTILPQTPPGSAISQPILGVGCVWAILDEAHITTLAIDPTFQRQGWGSVMLQALLRAAWRRGLEWATLEVRVSNLGAIALYKKFGFEAVGERKKYYQNPEENALILWRKGIQRSEFEQKLEEWEQETGDRLQKNGWSLQHN